MSSGWDVGASAARERSRFLRALVVSLLLHGLALALKPGVLSPGRGSGREAGVLQATLRATADSRSATDVPTLDAELSPPRASTVLVETPDETRLTTDPSVPPQSPGAASPPVSAQTASGSRVAGDGPQAGQGLSGVIPVLPPLPPLRPVTRRPSLLAPMTFSYPPNTPLQGGRVRVRILLGEKGEVEEMRVVDAAPAGVFDAAALNLLRSARFGPGYIGQFPTRSYLFMEVTYGPGPGGQQLLYAGSSLAPPVFRAPTPSPVHEGSEPR